MCLLSDPNGMNLKGDRNRNAQHNFFKRSQNTKYIKIERGGNSLQYIR